MKIARVPSRPVLSWPDVRSSQKQSTNISSLTDAPYSVLTGAGRFALYWALKSLGVGPGRKVVLPGYYCAAMVGPVRALGAVPVFCPISDALELDVTFLAHQAQSRDVAAVVAVHYFGFPFDFAPVARLCEERNIALIEDCAHLFTVFSQHSPVGHYGEYAIGSLMKFFPSYDGGILASYNRPISASKLRRPGLAYEMKCLFSTLELAAAAGRIRPFGSLVTWLSKAKRYIRLLPRNHSRTLSMGSSAAMDGGIQFEMDQAGFQCSRTALAIIKAFNVTRAAERQRANYQHYLERFPASKRHLPLFPILPADAVPYAFPLYVPGLVERSYQILRQQGVPMYRWDCSKESGCAISRRYAFHLLQLPCHSALTSAEIGWISTKVLQAVGF